MRSDMAGRYLLGLATGLLLFPLAAGIGEADKKQEAESYIERTIENKWGSVYILVRPIDGSRDIAVNWYEHEYPDGHGGIVKRSVLDEGGDGVYEYGIELEAWCGGRSLHFSDHMDRSTPRGIEYLDDIAAKANEARRKILEEAVAEDLLKQK